MASEVSRAFGTKINPNERRAFAPLNVQNQNLKPSNRLAENNNNKPQLQSQNAGPVPGFISGQENQFAAYGSDAFSKKSASTFQIFRDEGISSQERSFSIKLEDEERKLDVNMQAVEKELSGIVIEKSASSEIFDSENKENISTTSQVDDSMDVEESAKENSAFEDDSVLDHSEISYAQQYTEYERFADYADSILPYMLSKERKHMADPFYMNGQLNINAKMRCILVDWLVDVADEYNIKDETLFLTVNYIDRFLSKVSISRQEFQLLGTAALFIATKYEEIYPPEISEFVYITDDSFNKLQILQMEKVILRTLEFDVSTPTPNYFLEKFSCDLELDKEVFCFAKYLCFLTMLECTPFLKYFPSEIALCSIVQAANFLGVQLNEQFLNKTLDYERSLDKKGNVVQLVNDRKELLDELNKLQASAVEHQQQAIQRKFSTSKYYKVAKFINSN